MAENNQTTDPLAAENQTENENDPGDNQLFGAEDALPDLVRDPSLGRPSSGPPKGK